MSSTDELIKKIYINTHTHIYIYIHIYVIKYYSAIKKDEIMPFAAMWIDLEIIILSEVRQRQTSYETAYMWYLKK